MFSDVGAALLFLKSKCLVRRLKQTPVIHHQIQTTNEARSKNYRTDDGSYNSAKCPYVGMANQPFGKYADIVHRYDTNDPSPQLVADVFLTRRATKTVNVNLFAASWIQFMTHDWFKHKVDESELVRVSLRTTLHKTAFHRDGGVDYTLNENSSYWDGSQIYKPSLRAFDGTGHLRLDGNYLPSRDGMEDLGFGENIWFGLALLHLLFVKEHNSICDRLHATYPDFEEDTLHHTARLIVTAAIEKIHVLEWTPKILAAPITSFPQNSV